MSRTYELSDSFVIFYAYDFEWKAGVTVTKVLTSHIN